MDSAKDISKKIRSAIKAKLVELGAYVDDELPDYIMVMVANKKTQSQMTEDLSLFLGTNTDKFTTWLHGLLIKLQNLSSDNKKEPDSGKTARSDSQIKEKKIQKTGKSPQEKDEAKKIESSVKKSDVKKGTIKRKLSDGKGKAASGSKESVKSDTKTNTSNLKQKDEEYVSELLETVETDEFSEEFKKEEERRNKQAPVVTKPIKTVAASTSSTVKKLPVTNTVAPQKSKMIPTRDLSYPQPPPRKKVISKKVKTVVKKKPDSTRVKPYTHEKKAFSSVVGTVKKRYTEMPEDEEYDPLNPSFGKLSSSVKVQRKRLTVPASLQANKTLIMKATAEAQRSVTSTLNKVLNEEKLYSAKEQATVRPMQRKVPELRQPKIRPNIELVSKSKREEMMRKMTYTVENYQSEPKEAENMKIVVENRLKSHVDNSGLDEMMYTVVNKHSKVKHDPPSEIQYVVSEYPSQQVVQPVQYLTRLPPGMYAETTEPHLLTYVKVEPQQVDQEVVQPLMPAVARVEPVIDSRLVKRKSLDSDEEVTELAEESGEEEESNTGEVEDTDETSNGEEIYTQSPESGSVEYVEEECSEQEEYYEEESKDDIDSKTPVPSPPTERFIKERVPSQRKVNPKFIVTLDGIDPSAFEENSENDLNPEVAMQAIPVVSKITPSITPITFNLQDTDDEEGDEENSGESPPKRSKITEKCKFWPACVNGNACTYHHPTVPCRMFPNCKFADKCLYIHPNCKFDAKCTKKDCPFTHASKRGNTPTVIKQYIPMPVPAMPSFAPRPQGKIPCRFAGNCQNMYCPFQHPTNCRFGASCANQASCPFTHPSSATKYSWTAPKNREADKTKPTVITSQPS